MRNIIKSQFFQIVRDKVIRWMLVIAISMQILIILLPDWLGTGKATTTSEFFAVDGGMGVFMFPLFFLIVVTAEICGVDFLDKTHNYELMGGHRRIEVFLGRVIPALVIGGGGAFLLMLLPYGIHVVLYGWGTKIAFGQVVLRWLLMLLPLLRLVCEFALLTFLLKNPYIIMGLGYMFFILTTYLSEVIDSFNVFLGITNLSLLTMVSKWMTFGLDAKMNYIFEASLSAEIVWGTIIASVGFGVAALYLGYVFFKNDDMN